MIRFAYVDHDNADAVSAASVYPLGATNVPVRDGAVLDVVTGARPELWLYEVLDAPPRPPYTVQTGLAYAFTGTAEDPGARVQEARLTARIPLAELFEVKMGEISDQDDAVMFNAVDSDLSVSWWLIVTRTARHQIATTDRSALRRKIDGAPWPGGVNRPFVGIYNATSGEARRYQIDAEATWSTLMLELAEHDQATGAATDASTVSLEAKRATAADPDDTGDPAWDLVAAHDPADPAWGYPPTVQLPPGVLARFGG